LAIPGEKKETRLQPILRLQSTLYSKGFYLCYLGGGLREAVIFSMPLSTERDKAVGDKIEIFSGVPQFSCEETTSFADVF